MQLRELDGICSSYLKESEFLVRTNEKGEGDDAESERDSDKNDHHVQQQCLQGATRILHTLEHRSCLACKGFPSQ